MDLLFQDAVPIQNTLASKIIKSFADCDFETHVKYLPESCRTNLLTTESIQGEVSRIIGVLKAEGNPVERYDEKYQQELTEWIFKSASRVFAITAECDFVPRFHFAAIDCFYKSRFDDSRLPLDDPQSKNPSNSFFHPVIWNDVKLGHFYSFQWKYLAPIFSSEKYHYDLESHRIFPFETRVGNPKIGAFGQVYRVKIHEGHQRHPDLQDVAVKVINMSRAEDEKGANIAWEAEARALEDMNKIDHPHIIKCIAAISRGKNRYFIFPWADGDSLRDFWDATPEQNPTEQLILHAIQQLRALADALEKLHNFQGESFSTISVGSSKSEANISGLEVPQTRVVNERNEIDPHTQEAHEESYRHGDLKPENILRFLDQSLGLGTLKIADMGLAKRHVVRTQLRPNLTATRYGTIRYEAPEARTSSHGLSRLYDVWSMGCITLEFIIWILHGNDVLKSFYNQMKGVTEQVSQFYELTTSGPRDAEVHTVVRTWMDHIQETEPECRQISAIRELLNIVRTKLLVVPLPPDRPSTMEIRRPLAPPGIGENTTQYRATAAEFRDALDAMLAKVDQPHYLLTGRNRTNVSLPVPIIPAPKPDSLSPDAARRSVGPAAPNAQDGLAPRNQLLTGILPQRERADYSLPPLELWEFEVDNRFAKEVVAKVGSPALAPASSTQAQLCERCLEHNFWKPGFAFEDYMSDLLDRAKFCDFCRMLCAVCSEAEGAPNRKVRFERKQSALYLSNSNPLPALSIIRSPELEIPEIQIGLPELPKPGNDLFFEIIKLWLHDCNLNHSDCKGAPNAYVPTRLIDVGTLKEPRLRLIETREEEVSSHQYIALSHPWGDAKNFPPFSTLRKDPNGEGREIEKFKKLIPYDQLPATFKHAVDCTRALETPYLWIDSLCIIQGKDGDFSVEAKWMEAVFSNAYCVLAASRATHQHDGFLKPREPPRQYVTFQHGSATPFYICTNIDNYNQDVLEGSLNRRGWVLQERALAKRTVFFTENQTYFECGNGIRCETLTRTHNNMADFLGDPNFPKKAMRTTSRALKISYFQDLYRQYSRLGFTRYEDRPFAIAGLEKRLQKDAFHTRGGFGIFDDGAGGGLFHRSLLWQRGEDEVSMTPIEFPIDRNIKVPSWSWMAYKGGIDYADPPFQKADWEKSEIHAPWTRGGNHDTESAPPDDEPVLPAIVRDFSVKGRQADEVKLIYDVMDRTASDGQQRPQCVIVARSKEGRTDQDKRHYVLLVAATQATLDRGDKVYKRIGAGFMMGKYIELSKPGIEAKIY